MSYSSEVLADSPLVYYPCQETTGTILTDSSGHGTDGAVVNGAVVNDATDAAAPTALGRHIRLDGTDDYLDLASSVDWLDVTNGFTAEGWFYIRSAANWQRFFVFATQAGNNVDAIAMGRSRLTNDLFVNVNSSTNWVLIGEFPTLNAWHHVALTITTAGAATVYIDGAAVGSNTLSVPAVVARSMKWVGRSQYSADAYNPASVTQVAVYGTALPPSRISAHYTAGTAVPSAGISGTLAARAPLSRASFAASYGAPPASGTLSVRNLLPKVRFGAQRQGIGSLNARVPGIVTTKFVGSYSGTVGTDTSNALDGLVLDGTALVSIDTPVVSPPSTLVVDPGVDAAVALPKPTMVNGRPTGSYAAARAVSKPAGRDRIVIDGVDITYLRDHALQVPSYTLTEPFAYDATTLTIPQVNPIFEKVGSGNLRWARQGAKVKFQRVFADGSKVTDYCGVVLSVRAAGDALELGIGGQVSGPASLLNEQPPLFWRRHDVGAWVWMRCSTLGVHVIPRLGPNTGIMVYAQGGMTSAAWLQQLGALSQNSDGTQRALMPKTWGGDEWQFAKKDTTTVDCTIFLDGYRAAPSLVDDISEKPNTWFGIGTTPDGMRVRNGRYPGLMQGPAPAYPMSGGQSFGQGATDGDTSTGSGVRVLQFKLVWQNYLSADDVNPGVYDAATENAVERLQDAVNLPVTGTVDTRTWNRLFNVDATGYSLEGSRIFPMVQDPRVAKYLYTSDGEIAGLNPAYDPRILEVHRNTDFGGGVEKRRMVDWQRGQMHRLGSGQNWAGTITLNNVGAFSGQWQQGDNPPTSAVMSNRDIRPGMNAWLPGFDGGTLVHIAGCSVDGSTVTLTVDTKARDLMELAEIIKRNRESRRSIRREWNTANRVHGPSHDLITFDEYGGVLDHDVRLQGNRWNIVAVVAGQTGTLERVDVQLTNDKAEFCMAVFSREVTMKRLDRRIGNPFPVNKAGETWDQTANVQDWLDNKTILYSAGSEQRPCGYWPRDKYGDKTDSNGNPVATGAPINGHWRDDAGVPYKTPSDVAPLLWVAIYPDRDCTLQSGRILYKLEDDAV